MEIRELGENDAARYWTLRLEGLETEPAAFGVAAEEYRAASVEVAAARFRDKPEHDFTLGAFAGNNLIGIATFVRERGLKERHKGRIYGVYVPESQRQKGVGHALLAALLDRAKQDSTLEQILLAVAACQKAAGRLYQRFGFERYGTEPRALKLGAEYVDEDFMILRLR